MRLILILGTLWHASAATAVDPAVLKGSVADGVYTSPGAEFRVRVPALQEPTANVVDQAFGYGYVSVRFTDDLCRQFMVTRQPGTLEGLTLKDWISKRIVGDLKRQKIDVAAMETLDTANGPAVRLLYRKPRGAPCAAVESRDGQELGTADASVVDYMWYSGGSLYRITYVLGDMQMGAAGVVRGPAEKIAAEFADGFRILPAKAKQ